jgi:hypothetical protein
MLIRREDMDPHVVEAVMAGLTASFTKPDPSEAERRIQQAEQRRFRVDLRPFLSWIAGAFGLGAVSLAGLLATGFDPGLAVPVGMGVFWALFAAGMVRAISDGHRDANVLHSDLLAGWLPHLDLGRAERAYCETLVLLAKPRLQVDEQTARAILGELNGLMEVSRHLDSQRAELEGIAASGSVERIGEERASITERLTGITDPQARASLEQSLSLCETRLENARALQPVVQRLDAQQEMIIQSLASIQSTLARMEAAHQALTAPDADDIRRRLDEIRDQAHGVESAAQEIIALRAS